MRMHMRVIGGYRLLVGIGVLLSVTMFSIGVSVYKSI